jgi:arylsulfatase A
MNIDILPTLADIVGVQPGAGNIDGASLLALLRGARHSPHTYLYLFDNENIVAVRSQRWKFLTHAYYRRSFGAFEKFDSLDGFASSYDLLFDAGSSGGEEYSYADRHPETVAEMKRVLAAARAQFGELRTRPADVTFPK